MTRSLRLEALRAGDVRAIGVELGLEPARTPAEQRGHALGDALRAIEALAVAGADARAPQQDVLERDGQLVLHGQVKLGHDVGILRTEALTTAGHLAGPLDDAAGAAAIRRDQRLQRFPAEPRRRHLRSDVEPRVSLRPA